MGDLTRNLSRSEFACSDGCGLDTVDFELVMIIQGAVDDFCEILEEEVYVMISGGNRCPTVNENTPGAAKESPHMDCKAGDIKIVRKYDGSHIASRTVYNHLNKKYPNKYGLGLYYNRVHIDSRSGCAKRWS